MSDTYSLRKAKVWFQLRRDELMKQYSMGLLSQNCAEDEAVTIALKLIDEKLDEPE